MAITKNASYGGIIDLRKAVDRGLCGRRAGHMAFYNKQNGQQSGDPNKLAKALLMIASEAEPPRRFIAGADAIGIAEQKIVYLRAQINAYRDLSRTMAYDD